MAKNTVEIKVVDDVTLRDDIEYYLKKTTPAYAHKWAEDIIVHIATITDKSSKKDYPFLHKCLIPLKYYDEDPNGKNLKKLKAACKELAEHILTISDEFDKAFLNMSLSCMKSCFSKPDAMNTSTYAIQVINYVTENNISNARSEREWQFEKIRTYAKF